MCVCVCVFAHVYAYAYVYIYVYMYILALIFVPLYALAIQYIRKGLEMGRMSMPRLEGWLILGKL